MAEDDSSYDLEERTFRFALSVRSCVSEQTWKPTQRTDVNQLLRSSDSIAANYTEANNAVSKPDFNHKIGIARREIAESKLWLRLLGATSKEPSLIDQLRASSRNLTNSFASSPPSSANPLHRISCLTLLIFLFTFEFRA